MKEFTIRFAVYEDIPQIMEFIDRHWKKDHILSTDRELFEWQYINYGRVGFVAGIDSTGCIQGILGYLPYEDSRQPDLALALWKAERCREKPFLGLELLIFLMQETEYRHLICPGINRKTTGKVYQRLSMKVGVMQQWYRLGNKESYQLAKIGNKEIPAPGPSKGYYLRQFACFEQMKQMFDFVHLEGMNITPRKSRGYIRKRYFEHPSYHYYVYGIMGLEEKADAAVVLRLQECSGSYAVRFVDCIGDVNRILFVTKELDQLVADFGAEYIDMYEAGVDAKLLQKAGWIPVKGSGNIIPNYFSPFEQSNVEIYYSTSDEEAVIFKGDGDQDRPNS